MKKRRISMSSILLLILAFFIYSTTGVFTKMASMHEILSVPYIQYFSLVIISMGLYAVLWQIVLKKIPLANAFLFKSMTVMYGLVFANLIFDEMITWKNILGATFIISGIILNALNTSKV